MTGITQTINWEGLVVAKLGIDVGGNILPYVDAGVAFANITRDTDYADPTYSDVGSVSQTQVGWTIGAGVEAQLADHVTGFVSYNYADYGDADFGTGGYVPDDPHDRQYRQGPVSTTTSEHSAASLPLMARSIRRPGSTPGLLLLARRRIACRQSRVPLMRGRIMRRA